MTGLASPLDVSRRGRVLVLTLNDPQTRNALQPDLYVTAATALADASADKSVRAVLLTGAGGTFCSGGNLDRLRTNRQQPRAVQRSSVELLHGLVRAIRATPLPVIAAVEGVAAGAGFSLALACDLVVAATDAKFVMAHVKVGLNPDGGATSFLSRAMPPQLAAELLFTGTPVDAARLHELGIVNRLASPGSVFEEALAWAEKLAAGPRDAVARAKRLIETARRQDLDRQLDLEAELMTEAVHGDEAGEGIEAFFAKRPARF